MAENNSTYRIRTDIDKDKVLNIKLDRDVKLFEILSLKLNSEDAYKTHDSNYGVIVGRVLANDAFGIPNAKVSIFVKLSDEDALDNDITSIYPYTSVDSQDSEGRRYNLLPDDSNDECYRAVGSFPNKRYVLDNDNVIEIYDKYWKYTTVTNEAGDYMLYGIPVGSQEIHVDLDLSDIGILSQKPRDFYYKGYTPSQFDNANQFKESTNLASLSQIFTQNESVYVYPFWGDSDNVAITRCDIQIQYKFEPTCVFFGSVATDDRNNAIDSVCGGNKNSGMNKYLISNEGTIEMIRKTVDGLVEEYQIQGNRLIDSDGVFCYQIPMNLDYVGTDEYGNIVPTDNPKKGIPTRTCVRFRFSLEETGSEAVSHHRAKYLVPNNPKLRSNSERPQIERGDIFEQWAEFGSSTPDEYFRDLYWNKVYSVKNYIPRTQNSNKRETYKYNAIRTVNNNEGVNPAPFNKVRFRLSFPYRVLCMLMTIVVGVICGINTMINILDCICIPFLGCVFKISCIKFGAGLNEGEAENIEYVPCCGGCGRKKTKCSIPGCTLESDFGELTNSVQQNLSLEYETVNLDFANDWLNGCLYMPLWYWRKTPKKKFLFGLFSKKAKNRFCDCDKIQPNLRVYNPCSISNTANMDAAESNDKGNDWHKKNSSVKTTYGFIKQYTNKDGLNIYYYAPGTPTNKGYQNDSGPCDYVRLFSTDIILLGSLNSCDLDGLPQAFLEIPHTTANVPFLTTVRRIYDDDTDESDYDSDTNGIVEITGMDWLGSGTSDKPKHGKGLLFDISCSSVNTKPKTCLNTERMSELGVTLDMYTEIYTSSNGTLNTEGVTPDGMITRYEIVGDEARAMFASLNHNGLTEKVFNKNTGYDTYKLHYMYPTDFDGRMSFFSTNYTSMMPRKTYDNRNDDYVLFKMGTDEKYHFYDGDRRFPLYNNSYYFYFGVHEGSTAIDKFNSMYFATCYKNTKYPFKTEIETKSGKWCYDKANVTTDFGYIKAKFTGLKMPYSYELSKEGGDPLLAETGMTIDTLIFGVKINEDGTYATNADGTYVLNGKLAYYKTREEIDEYLENDTYILTVTDGNGKSYSQSITVSSIPISINYTTVPLGTKYYNTESVKTDKEEICDNEKQLYGEIRIESINLDGVDYKIESVSKVKDGIYDITLKGYTTVGPHVQLTILHSEYETDDTIDEFEEECTCNKVGNVNAYDIKDGTLIFNIFTPGEYFSTANQYCNGGLNDNVTTTYMQVKNGEAFKVYFNDVPMKFLVGENSSINTKLYEKKNSSNILDGWLKLYDEKSYQFPAVNISNAEIWNDYISFDSESDDDGNSVISDAGKAMISQYKAQCVFDMLKTCYVTSNSNNFMYLKHGGGKSPILYRGAYPSYDDFNGSETPDNKFGDYITDSSAYITVDERCPNVVGFNYSLRLETGDVVPVFDTDGINNTLYKGATNKKPIYNPLFNESGKLGNYFAAFTQNGGLNASGMTVPNVKYIEYPTKASPLRGVKLNTTYNTIVSDVYGNSTYNQYFRGLFVDKRLDYDLTIFTPFGDDNYKGEIEPWMRGGIDGYIYNGTPMAYEDGTYNIFGDGLEYSEKTTDGQFKYNNPTKKKFYKATLKCGSDVLDLNQIDGSIKLENGTTYDTYPLIHKIKMNGLKSCNKLTLSLSDCNYDVKPLINDGEDGVYTLQGQTDEGNEVTFDIDCRNPVTVELPTLDECAKNNKYNVGYMGYGVKYSGNTAKYHCVGDTNIAISFKIKSDTYNTTHMPVFAEARWGVIGGRKDIGMPKWFESAYNDDLTKAWYSFCTKDDNYPFKMCSTSKPDDMPYQYGTKHFYIDRKNGDSVIADDNTLFKSVTFKCDGEGKIEDGRYFAILIAKHYFNTSADFLFKRVRTLSLSSLLDLRDFRLTFVNYEEEKISGDTTVSGETDMPTISTDTDKSGNTTVSTGTSKETISSSGSTNIVLTTLEFLLSFDGADDNQAFASGNISVVIRAGSKNNIMSNTYLVPHLTGENITSYTIYCPLDGTLLGKKFKDVKGYKYQFYVRTSTGFVYEFDYKIP